MRFVPEYQVTKRWGHLKGAVLWTFSCVLGTSSLVSVIVFGVAWSLNLDDAFRRNWGLTALLVTPLAVGIWRRNALRGLNRITESFLPKDVVHPLLVATVLVAFSIATPTASLLLYAATLIIVEAFGLWWVWHFLPREAKSSGAEYDAFTWLKISIPMIFITIMQLGLNRWDVLILGSVSSMEETGLYSAATRVSLMASIVARIVGFAISPMVASAYHAGRHEDLVQIISKSVAWTFVGILPIAFLMLVWPELILEFFGARFRPAGTLLRILILGQLAHTFSMPFQMFLLMAGHERLSAKLMLFAAAGSLLGCLILIPLYGSVAAAWVNSLSLILYGAASILYGRSRA
jgi:O-antigen/teichoic acid export membrane protein